MAPTANPGRARLGGAWAVSAGRGDAGGVSSGSGMLIVGGSAYCADAADASGGGGTSCTGCGTGVWTAGAWAATVWTAGDWAATGCAAGAWGASAGAAGGTTLSPPARGSGGMSRTGINVTGAGSGGEAGAAGAGAGTGGGGGVLPRSNGGKISRGADVGVGTGGGGGVLPRSSGGNTWCACGWFANGCTVYSAPLGVPASASIWPGVIQSEPLRYTLPLCPTWYAPVFGSYPSITK